MAWLEKRERGRRKKKTVFFLSWREGGVKQRKNLGEISSREAKKILLEFERLRMTESLGIEEQLEDVTLGQLCQEYLDMIRTHVKYWSMSLGE